MTEAIINEAWRLYDEPVNYQECMCESMIWEMFANHRYTYGEALVKIGTLDLLGLLSIQLANALREAYAAVVLD